MSKLLLGERAQSRVTGFEGIVTGTHKYLYGSPQTTLTSTTLSASGTTVAETFEDDELVSTESGHFCGATTGLACPSGESPRS